MMAYPAMPQESTGLMPNELMLGREVFVQIDVQIGPPAQEDPLNENFYVEELRINMENVYDLAQENLGTSAEKQKRLYDLGAIDEPYAKRDLVSLVNKSRCKRRCPQVKP